MVVYLGVNEYVRHSMNAAFRVSELVCCKRLKEEGSWAGDRRGGAFDHRSILNVLNSHRPIYPLSKFIIIK